MNHLNSNQNKNQSQNQKPTLTSAFLGYVSTLIKMIFLTSFQIIVFSYYYLYYYFTSQKTFNLTSSYLKYILTAIKLNFALSFDILKFSCYYFYYSFIFKPEIFYDAEDELFYDAHSSLKENTKRDNKSHSQQRLETLSSKELFYNKNRSLPLHVIDQKWNESTLKRRQAAALKARNASIEKKKEKFFMYQAHVSTAKPFRDPPEEESVDEVDTFVQAHVSMDRSPQDSTPTFIDDYANSLPLSSFTPSNSNDSTSFFNIDLKDPLQDSSNQFSIANILTASKQILNQISTSKAWPHISVLIPNLVIIFRSFYNDPTVAVLALYNIVNVYAPAEAAVAVGLLLTFIILLKPKSKDKHKKPQTLFLKAHVEETTLAKAHLPGLESLSTFHALGGIILTSFCLIFLYRIPTKNDFDSVFNRFGKVSQNMSGISGLYSKCSELSTVCVDWYSEKFLKIVPDRKLFKTRIINLQASLMEAATAESQHKLMTDVNQVTHVDNLYQESLLLTASMPSKAAADQHRPFHATALSLHRKALISPQRGSKSRVEPVVIHLFGNAKTGKTSLVSPLAIDILKHIDKTSHLKMAQNYSQHIFYRKVGMKFWTNYNASQHMITVIDDANQICQKFNESIPVPGELIHLTNSAECPLEVAEVENKPFAYFNSRAIILTDNIKDPPLTDVIIEADAYKRRIHFEVKVQVKPEFGYLFRGTNETYYRMQPDTDSLNLEKYCFTLYDEAGEEIHSNIDYSQLIKKIQYKIDETASSHQSFQNQLDLYANTPEPQQLLPTNPFYDANVKVKAHSLTEVAKSFYVYELAKQSPFSCFSLFYIQIALTFSTLISLITITTYPLFSLLPIFTNILLTQQICKKVKLSFRSFLYTQALLIDNLYQRLMPFARRVKLYRPSYKIKLALFISLPFVLYLIYKIASPKGIKVKTRKMNPRTLIKKLQNFTKLNCQTRFDLNEDIIYFDREYADLPYFKFYRDLWELNGYAGMQDPEQAKQIEQYYSQYRDLVKAESAYAPQAPQVPRHNTLPHFVAENAYAPQAPQIARTSLKPVFKAENTFCPLPALPLRNLPVYTNEDALTLNAHVFTLDHNLKYTPLNPLAIEPIPDLSPFRNNSFEKCTAEYLSDTNTQEIINSSIFTNLYLMEIFLPSDLVQRCNVFFIRGHLAVTNAHCLHLCDDKTFLRLSNANLHYDIPFSAVSTFRVKRDNLNRDLVYIIFPRHYLPAHKDISSKFLPINQLARHFKTTAVCTSYRKIKENLVLTMHYTDMIYYSRNLCANNMNGNLFDYHYHRSTTTEGDCGAPLLILDKKTPQKILGIHSAGSEDSGLSLFISSEELDFVKLNFSAHSICIQNFSDSLKFNSPLEYKKLRKFSLSELATGNFIPIAEITNSIFIPNETKIQPSLLHDQVFKHTTIPAILKSSYNLNIYENNLRKYFSETRNISLESLNYMKHRIIHRFGGVSYSKITLEEAIKGNDILVPLDRTTSAGIPWIFEKTKTKGKTQWLGQNENWIIDNEALCQKINDFEELVLKDSVIPPIFFLDQTKDERRPIDKVLKGKTRMFAIGPMHFSILFRQYFSWFDSHCKQHRIYNGSLVGIDPHSFEWTKVFNHMSEINDPKTDCFLAGDYSNFDGSLNRSILWIIFDSIIEIGKVNKNSSDYKIMLALWTCLTDSLHIHKQHIYQLNHSQPSGNPFTTIINTLYNLGILDFCIFFILRNNDKLVDNLDAHYHAYAYGDDNLMIFSDYLKDSIDPLDITHLLSLMGHTYTTDLKDDSQQAYRSIEEVSILKRKFDFDYSLFYCFAPLELDTVLEMLNWDKERNYGTKLTQLFVNGDTMQRELLHHHEFYYDLFWLEKTLPALEGLGFKSERVLPYPILRNLHASTMKNA
jgi:V8-like Glu-specific endopeptidase